MRRPPMWGRVGLHLWLAVVLFGCSSDDTFLPALLADPMADYEAHGIELIGILLDFGPVRFDDPTTTAPGGS